MNDDIVARLHHEAKQGWDYPILTEAANEIERLRKELDIYKDLYAAEIVEKAMKK